MSDFSVLDRNNNQGIDQLFLMRLFNILSSGNLTSDLTGHFFTKLSTLSYQIFRSNAKVPITHSVTELLVSNFPELCRLFTAQACPAEGVNGKEM